MLQYRKELDGLRALAVIAVLFYHVNLVSYPLFENTFFTRQNLFRGGFLGVDVFFVLSGFLITAMIKSAMDNQTFSFRDFYIRRAKRIIPVFLIVLGVATVGAYLLLFPAELMQFAQSLKSALYFGSNFFFYGDTAYMSDSSIYKPLLHTWSLAVEWQFYMLYPVFFWFVYRYFRSNTFWILVVLSVVSLCFAQWTTGRYPDFSFYLLPTRAWELMFGGLIVLIERDVLVGKIRNHPVWRWLPMAGILLVLGGLFLIDDKVAHPSFITLIPVLGTVLFILFSHDRDGVTFVFSWKPVVFIGVISYSIYLWHQPLFVYFRYIKYERIRTEQFVLLCLVCLVLSWLSYRFIESPFRKKRMGPLKLGFLVAVWTACGAFAFTAIAHDGFGNKLAGLEKLYDIYKIPESTRLTSPEPGTHLASGKQVQMCFGRTSEEACRFGDESWVSIGDSFEGSLDYALHEKLMQQNKGLIVLTHGQCPFISSKWWFGTAPECSIVNEKRWETIRGFKDKKNIVISAALDNFVKGKPRLDDPVGKARDGFAGGTIDPSAEDEIWQSYADNIKALLSLGHKVTLIYMPVNPGQSVEKTVTTWMRKHKSADLPVTYSEGGVYEEAMKYNARLDRYIPDQKNLYKVRQTDIFCDSPHHCKIIGKEGGYYNGGPHLSYWGAKKVVEKIPLLNDKE